MSSVRRTTSAIVSPPTLSIHRRPSEPAIVPSSSRKPSPPLRVRNNSSPTRTDVYQRTRTGSAGHVSKTTTTTKRTAPPPTRASSASAVSAPKPPIPPRAATRKPSNSTVSRAPSASVSSIATSTVTRKKPSLSSPSPITGPVVPCTTLPRNSHRPALSSTSPSARRPSTSPLSSPTATSPTSPTAPRPSPTATTAQGGMIKRLLAKPAPPVYFSGSESDRPRRAWTSEEERPSKSHYYLSDSERRKALSDMDDMDSETQLAVLDAHLASLGLGTVSEGRGSMDTDVEVATRTRAAVVRRARGEPTASPPPSARLPISSSAVQRSLSASATTVVRGRGSSPSLHPPASITSTSSRTPSPSHSQRPLSPAVEKKNRNTLTPASALVEAYKMQEKEREEEEKRRREEREEMKRQSKVLEMRLEKAVKEEEEARQRAKEEERERMKASLVTPPRISTQVPPQQSRPSTASSYTSPTHTRDDTLRRIAIGNTSQQVHSRFYSASTNTSTSGLSIPASRAESRAWVGKGFEVIERMHGDSPPESTNTPQQTKEEEPATPYYTVFGASERVEVGTEGNWDTRYWDAGVLRPAEKEKEKEKEKTVLKTLSRKVSGHWRRVQDEDRGRASLQEKRVVRKSSRRDVSAPGEGDMEEERRRILSRRRSLRLSIDKCSSPVRSESDGHGVRRGNASGSGSSKAMCESDEEDYGTPVKKLVKPRRDKEKEREKDKDKDKDEKGGNKLWKLMKRISTGGLREKYIQEDLPPVPALPKEYEQRNGSRSSEGGPPLTQSKGPPSSNLSSPSSSAAHPSPPSLPPISAGGGALSRLVSRSSTSSATSPPTNYHHTASRKTSLSAIRFPSVAFPSSPISPIASGPITNANTSPAGTGSATQPHPRPSTTTRSSSPLSSSDVASSRFFNRTHSTKSSTSSVEEVPPLPKPSFVGHHIVPPSELGKDEGAAIDARVKKVHPRLGQLNLPPPTLTGPRKSREDDWTIVDSPAVELPSLPFPPRRPNPRVKITSNMDDETGADGDTMGGKFEFDKDRPPSPDIPSFTTAGAINAFPARRASGGSSIKSPASSHSSSPSATMPPRPPRSTERPSPRSASPDRSQIYQGRKSESAATAPTNHHHHRHSSGSTMRAWRRSSSFGSKSAQNKPTTPTRPSTAVPTGTRMTFRELGSSGRKHALTEKEKADIWDDLLERSDRAGGTIHLGAGEALMSDKLSMRLSVASEVPSLG